MYHNIARVITGYIEFNCEVLPEQLNLYNARVERGHYTMIHIEWEGLRVIYTEGLSIIY